MTAKKVLLYLLLLIVSFSLCGCGITNSKAKRAAQEYIEDKYGQTAQIKRIKKNYKFTGPGGGLLPTGIKSDESYNLIMEIDGKQFDVCLLGDGSDYFGYDNYEAKLIKSEIVEDIENQFEIYCEDIFLSYGAIYDKYGTNMIHNSYSDLSSIYESGKCAIIVATYDPIDAACVEEYAAKYSVSDEKSLLRIELLQYKDEIPPLSFSSFYLVSDPEYVLDWYTIANGSVEEHVSDR